MIFYLLGSQSKLYGVCQLALRRSTYPVPHLAAKSITLCKKVAINKLLSKVQMSRLGLLRY